MNTHSVTYYLNKKEVDFDDVVASSSYCAWTSPGLSAWALIAAMSTGFARLFLKQVLPQE